jgi:hypothetical protein
MKSAHLFVLALVGAVLTCAQASAQVALLFDNGPMDHLNGGEVTFWTEADDFELGYSAVATRVDIGMADTTCTFPANWDGILRWWVYQDDGGLPGPMVSTGIVPNVAVYPDLDECPAYAWYTLSFPLGQQVWLDGGVRYWLAIHMGGDWSLRRDLYWATTSVGFGANVVVQQGGTGPWTSTSVDLSFMILAYGDDEEIFVEEFESGDFDIWSEAIT